MASLVLPFISANWCDSVEQIKKEQLRLWTNNEQIYYIVDAINDAINEEKQISFQYYEYTGLKEKVLKNKGEVYTISPYHLVWNDDYYYVVLFWLT